MTIQRTYLSTQYCNPSMPKEIEEGKRFSHSRSVLTKPTKSIRKKPSENSQSPKNKNVSFNDKVGVKIVTKYIPSNRLVQSYLERFKHFEQFNYPEGLSWEIDDDLLQKISKIRKDYSLLLEMNQENLEDFLNTQQKNINFINLQENPTSVENIKKTSSTIKTELALKYFLRKIDELSIRLGYHLNNYHRTMSPFRKVSTEFIEEICLLNEKIRAAIRENNNSIKKILNKPQRRRWWFYKKKTFDTANVLDPLERHPHFLKKFLQESLKKPLQEFSPIASTTVRNSTSYDGFTRSRASSFPPKRAIELNTPRSSDCDYKTSENQTSLSGLAYLEEPLSYLEEAETSKYADVLISTEDEKKSNQF